MTDHRLDLGPIGASLDLVDADGMAGLRDYWFTALADGFSFGNPESVRVVAPSMLQDGDDERIQRYGNRTITFDVKVNGYTSADIGAGERALRRLLGKRTLLRWTPPGPVGSLTRFVVLTSEWQQQFDDLDEVRDGVKSRTWRISLTCEPFGTSESPRSVTFAPSTAEPVVVDDASSLTRWAASAGATLSTSTYGDGTSIQAFQQLTGFNVTHTLPASLATAYVAIDVSPALRGTTTNVAYGGTTSVSLNFTGANNAVAVEPGQFYTRYWFRNPGGTDLTFRVRYSGSSSSAGLSWQIGGLYSSNAVNGRGVLTAEVEGSVRTNGSLRLTRTTPMAWAIVYTDPVMASHGFSPSNMATWNYAPAGRYALWAKGTPVATSGDVISARIFGSGMDVTKTTVAQGNTTSFRPIEAFDLGAMQSGVLGNFSVAMARNGANVNMADVELRLFRVDPDVALTVARPGGANEIAIEAPSLERATGGLWIDGFSSSGGPSFQFPALTAGACAVFVEADNSASAPVTTALDYWPKWDGFAP